MYTPIATSQNAHGLRIGIAISRYHDEITSSLCDAAVEWFIEAGGREDDLLIVPAPGTFELVAICRAMAERGNLHAAVALGCVITGETTHDQYIAASVANGLQQITVHTNMPVAFGVLTCQTIEQAQARAGGEKGNKGAEAMAAAIECAHSIDAVTRMKERQR